MVELPQSRSRLVFVDGLRLLAALQMVQGHTLDALLAEELRHGPLFRGWTFARGLTSTAFLLTAGLAFALAHEAAGLEPAAGRRRRLRRALSLLVIGYALRAPLGILFGDEADEALRNALAVDVLQCIAVSLMLAEALFVVAQSRRARALLAAGLGALCFGLGPWSDGVRPAGWLAPLTSYLSANAGSLFPLLPWAGFVFWGVSIGQTTLGLGRRALVRALSGWATVACVGAGALFVALPGFPARISPAYCALRLGLVLWVASGLAALLEGRTLPRLLRRLGSETLFLYVSHVLILYAGHVGLAQLVGRTQGLGLALLWALALLVGCCAGALGYRAVQPALQARWGRGTPRAQPPLPPG